MFPDFFLVSTFSATLTVIVFLVKRPPSMWDMAPFSTLLLLRAISNSLSGVLGPPGLSLAPKMRPFFPERDDNRRGLTAGAELSQADFGKLVQKIKSLSLGFQPAQIRALLLADSKTCTKLSKGLEANATKDSFLAAAKRLGLTPKIAASPSSATEPAPPPAAEEEEAWRTVSRKSSPKAKPKAAAGNIKPPPKPRHFALAPEGWSVPVLPCADIRPDTPGICAVDDENVAHETWARCKNSGKAIALVGPRDLKVGTAPPKRLLVPLLEQVEGLPDRKIDLQIWLHQITEHAVTFPWRQGCKTSS